MKNLHELPGWPEYVELTAIRQRKADEDVFQHVPVRFNRSIEPWIMEGSIYEDAIRSINDLNRLSHIYQLSHIAFVGLRPEDMFDPSFFHSRYEHTLQTARISEHILQQNGFSEQDQITAIVAALLHDVATPAGGDASKRIDEDGLHEEHHWMKMVQDDSSRDFFERHQVDPNVLDDIIKNRGILGKVLDISDKIAYVTEDLHHLGDFPNTEKILLHQRFPELPIERPRKPYIPPFATPDERELYETISVRPDVGDIVDDVMIDQDSEQIYFTNPHRLYSLLKIRTLLFKTLYMHPRNQIRDIIFADMLRPLYSPDDNDSSTHITPQTLLTIGDLQLMNMLKKRWGVQHLSIHPHFIFQNIHPKYQEYSTPEEGEVLLQQIGESSDNLIITNAQVGTIKSGSDWLVKVPASSLSGTPGTIAPLNEAYPHKGKELDAIASSIEKRFIAYYTLGDDRFDPLMEKLYGETTDQS